MKAQEVFDIDLKDIQGNIKDRANSELDNWLLQRIENEMRKVRNEIAGQSIELPDNLSAMVREELEDEPDLSWDEAVWRIAEGKPTSA